MHRRRLTRLRVLLLNFKASVKPLCACDEMSAQKSQNVTCKTLCKVVSLMFTMIPILRLVNGNKSKFWTADMSEYLTRTPYSSCHTCKVLSVESSCGGGCSVCFTFQVCVGC